jgi:hypothetical protein
MISSRLSVMNEDVITTATAKAKPRAVSALRPGHRVKLRRIMIVGCDSRTAVIDSVDDVLTGSAPVSRRLHGHGRRQPSGFRRALRAAPSRAAVAKARAADTP